MSNIVDNDVSKAITKGVLILRDPQLSKVSFSVALEHR